MSQESKFRYLAKNTLLFTISSFGSKILAFLLVPFYTNILSTEEYGTVDLVTTTSSLLLFVVTLCIADAVMRFAIEIKTNHENILRYGTRITMIGCGIFFLLLFPVSYFKLIDWPSYCYIFLALHLFLSSFHSLCTNYLRAIDKVRQVSVAGILSTFVTIASNIFFLLIIRNGIIGYMISMILSLLITLIYEIHHCGGIRTIFYGSVCDKNTQKEMINYSIPLIFNGVGWWVNSSIDKYFISIICGVAVNGIYSVSYKIPMIMTTCQQIFSQAWSLSAIKEFDKEDKDGFFSKIYNTYNVFLILVCSSLIIFNIPISKLLFAKEFYEAWKYSSFLLISVIFSALSSFLGSVISATKKSKSLAISTIVSAGVNIILNAILIPIFGALGAAFATSISFFSIWIIRLITVRKYIKWKINIFMDFIAYALLFAQAFSEQFEKHLYVLQLSIVILLIFIYRKTIKEMARKTMQVVNKKQRRL